MKLFCLCLSLVLTSFQIEWINGGFSFLTPEIPRIFAPSAVSEFWPANIFSLVSCATVVSWSRITPRLGTMRVYIASLLWLAIWCLAAGFAPSIDFLCVSRAMQGLAVGALIPAQYTIISQVALADSIVQNRLLSWTSAFGPLGFMAGNLVAACSVTYLSWSWFFWALTILTAANLVFALTSWSIVPPCSSQGKPDGNWIGSILLAVTLLLVAYVLAVCPYRDAGSISVVLPAVAGAVALTTTCCNELFFAARPLLPRALFGNVRLNTLMVGRTLQFASGGIFVYYYVFFGREVANKSLLETGLWWIPACITGFCLAKAVGLATEAGRERLLLTLSATSDFCWILSPLLVAIVPQRTGRLLPFMIVSTVLNCGGYDTSFTHLTIELTQAQSAENHGLIGCLAYMLVELGTSFGLAIANVIQERFLNKAGFGANEYAPAFWLATTLAALGTLASICTYAFRFRKPEDTASRDTADLGSNVDAAMDIESTASSPTDHEFGKIYQI